VDAAMKDTYSEIAITTGAALARTTDMSERMLEELYDQYAQSLFRFALSLVGSPDDAEDAVQEVFVRMAREHKRVLRIRNVKAYLFMATRNAAYSRLRERCRQDKISEAMIMDTESCSVDMGSRFAESEAVNQAFDKLPVEQREVLALKVFEQMTFDEIARTIGTVKNTVASRYRYGIAKLRLALEE
jgi:RNA polymerase sigma-70 factor (ECF subfamily)